MMKLIVQISKEETSETHRWKPFLKVYFYIVHCVKLVKKQGKIIEPTSCNCPQWILIILKYNPSNLSREATPATPEIRRALKVVTYDVKALHVAFLDTLETIF